MASQHQTLPDDATLATALRGALQPGPSRTSYEEVLRDWEAAPGFCSAVLRASQVHTLGLTQAERLLAVLCLKNAVSRRWQRRSPNDSTVSDAEKASLRGALLALLHEPDEKLWAQLELTIATIGKVDGLAAWPALMPTLLDAAGRPDPRDAARGLSALYRVVKQQASRRLLAQRKEFIAMAAELLPRLAPLRQAHAASLLSGVAQRSAAEAAAWLGGPAPLAASSDGSGGGGGSALLRAATWLCKLER